MTHPYDKRFSPPAPVLVLEITLPEDPQLRTQLDAKLDTAADISAIPARMVSEWELEPASEIIIAGYDGRAETVPTYTVGFELSQARVRRVEVVVIPEAYVLLGRDVLNHFYINLNGPDLTFEMEVSP